MSSDLEIGILLKATDEASAVMTSARREIGLLGQTVNQTDLGNFAKGLAGISGLMPGTTLQSFALRNAISAIGSSAGMLGLATGGAIGGLMLMGGAIGDAAKAASDFDYQMTITRNNANMTDSDFALMTSTVKDLASTTGSATKDLADGFRQLMNEGFSAADAVKVLTAANQLAVATGSDVADNAKEIGAALKDYSLSAEQAANVENALYVAQQGGNLTQQQLAQSAEKLIAINGALKGSFSDILASLASLTAMGIPADQAVNGLMQDVQHLIAPTPQAAKLLQELGREAGVDLVSDFSSAGLATRGLGGVLEDLRNTGIVTDQDLEVLFGHTRGGVPAIIESTTAWDGYKQKLGEVQDALDGKVTPATEAFGRVMDTTDQKGKVLQQRFALLKVAVGEDFSKAGGVAADVLVGLSGGFDSLGQHIFNATQQLNTFLETASGINERAAAAGVGTSAPLSQADQSVIAAEGSALADAQSDVSGVHSAPATSVGTFSDADKRALLAANPDLAQQIKDIDAQQKAMDDTTSALAHGEMTIGSLIKRRGGGGGGGTAGVSAALGIGGMTRQLQDQRDALKAAADEIDGKYSPAVHALNQEEHEQEQQLRPLEEQQRALRLEYDQAAQTLKARYEPQLLAAKDHLADLEKNTKSNSAAVKDARDGLTHLTDEYQRQRQELDDKYQPALDDLNGKQQVVQDQLSITQGKIQDLRDGFNVATDDLKGATIPSIDQLIQKLDGSKDALQRVKDDIVTHHIPALEALKKEGLDPNTQAAQDFAAALNAIPKDIEVKINTTFTSSGAPTPGTGGNAIAGLPDNGVFGFNPGQINPGTEPDTSIPHFATGGMVLGPKGMAMPAIVHGGEYVVPPEMWARPGALPAGSNGGSASNTPAPLVVNVNVAAGAVVGVSDFEDMVVHAITNAERRGVIPRLGGGS